MTVLTNCGDPWITNEALLASPRACLIPSDPPPDAGVVTGAARDASAILSLVSGRVITGICTSIVRPVIPDTICVCETSPLCPMRALRLTAPIQSIEQVLVDGEELTYGTDFAVFDRTWLLRLASADDRRRRHWPVSQRLDLPATELRTFEVTYRHGDTPPPWTADAVAELGAELLLYRLDLETRITGVASFSAGGTVIDLERASDVIANQATSGETAFPSVLRFIKLVNRREHVEPAEVLSPDVGLLLHQTDATPSLP